MWSRLFEYDYYWNNHLAYHNADHIESMYNWLVKQNVEYDRALDLAVLYHDSVYDEFPDKEIRSAQLLYDDLVGKEQPEDLGRAIKMILSTREHLAEDKDCNLIIKADLHALTSRSEAIRNYSKIMDESIALYDVTEYQFAKANLDFMRGLQNRVHRNMMNLDQKDSVFWSRVSDGIYTTINLSNLLVGQK